VPVSWKHKLRINPDKSGRQERGIKNQELKKEKEKEIKIEIEK